MKKIFISFMAACLSMCAMAQKPAFVKLAEQSNSEAAALAFFESEVQGDVYTVAQLADLSVEKNPVLWVMVDKIGLNQGAQNLPEDLATVASTTLQAYVKAGGNLVLTNHATQLSTSIGRIAESYAPGIYGNGAGGHNPDAWGSQPVIGNAEGQIYDHTSHPIYKDMSLATGLYERGIYPFIDAGNKLDHNCMWDLNAYGLTPNPNVVKTWEDLTNSVVLGTWNHVVDYCCAGIVEFLPTTEYKGTVLCVGLAAYDWAATAYDNNMKIFSKNMLNYLMPEPSSINNVVVNNARSERYNLAGQHVDANHRGIVIMDGKKIMK